MGRKTTDSKDPDYAAGAAPAPEPAVSTQTAAEFAELLRSVMRSIGPAPLPTPVPPPPPAPSPPPLSAEALEAVAQFRAISADLKVATVFTA